MDLGQSKNPYNLCVDLNQFFFFFFKTVKMILVLCGRMSFSGAPLVWKWGR